ncbi:GspE/PulE family protein [Geofilum rubicundum]|uniref:Type IV fimbrial assembly, ATPase PilB n=1 Tax=Geofilum rubicundum JCM 15548 TaxID=1236989 RepID=A0A0E9M3F7_9BACT|nr:GspE/PulE family protein [Geofilum rubicundum]GAO31946.1 type IV fimbrial assembly, ATPase PilB [Geofilum rubicundum JCM 15548]
MTDNQFLLSTELKQLLSTDQAWHYRIIPAGMGTDGLKFYYAEGLADLKELDNELVVLLGKNVQLLAKDADWVQQQLSRFYPRNGNKQKSPERFSVGQKGDFLVQIIEEAARINSSDIHFEAFEDRCRVRFRIDGKLVERYVLNRSEYPSIVNKIKIKANLDISEKRLPQDGRIFFSEGDNKFDIRVSVLPTLHGEKTVLRLLKRDATEINLETLGFYKKQLKDYMEGIRRPNGIILISGPTGSGKTTTLYATLKQLNNDATNILTIEDPIEYTLDGINQVQLKESIGMDFASALRTFLRQDPDIIMVGEIRDAETAQMAVRAALTGHLVLSTVHTNSAWGTVTRLVDMGIPAYLVAATLNLSAAQRLVRCLCKHCKEEHPFNSDLFPPGFVPPIAPKVHFVAKGCKECYFTGYSGRRALYEIIPIGAELKMSIRDSRYDIGDYLGQQDIMSLSASAYELFQCGDTSLDEVYSILAIS